MKLKKILTLVLSVCLVMPISISANASCNTEEKKLTFNDDGKFRIMFMSDFQDIDYANTSALDFFNKALDYAKPDLVVMGGDQLSSSFPMANKRRIKNSLRNILKPLDDRGIPFLFTFGNHDHDLDNVLSPEKQAQLYYAYEYCFAEKDGNDPGTYNKLIYSSDGKEPILNIYMMDTNNKHEADGTYDGVHADQVEWYKNKSDELKKLNGGKIIPSLLFQHMPVKEIFNLLKVVPEGTPDSYKNVNSGLDYYYALDTDKLISTVNSYGETPCSEIITRTTGQYEAWLEKGDIKYGAFFGHDHKNDFVGVTDDGIILGYTSGCGFRSYSLDEQSSVKLFDFDENNMDNCEITRVRYCDLPGKTGYTKTNFIVKILNFFSYLFNEFLDGFFSAC